MKKQTVAGRAYRTLLLLFPADFRKEFGDDMAQMFRDRYREARLEPLGLARFSLQAFGDVLVHGTKERKRLFERAWLRGWEGLSSERKKRGTSMNSFVQDARYAFRTLWKSPVFF